MKSLKKSVIEELQLEEERKGSLMKVCSYLCNHSLISGTLLGGSLSYKKDKLGGDVDLFCLVYEKSGLISGIINDLEKLTEFEIAIYQGVFPWTENLFTFFHPTDLSFSLDIAFIPLDKVESFFWEPNGIILFDKENLILDSRSKQMNEEGYTKQPLLKSNPLCMSVISVKKIHKNLKRGHLWNALDQVRNFRRYLMQFIRLNVLKNDDFLGRVDREIEDVLPTNYLDAFSKSIPNYSESSIREKTIMLIELTEHIMSENDLEAENDYAMWIMKHLAFEKERLLNY